MLERSEPILRIAGYCLGALVIYQLLGVFFQKDPLDGLVLPTLAVAPVEADPAPETKPATPPSPGMPGPRGVAPPKAEPLPADLQAQVDRVHTSEILGPIPHPLPMALLGIGGRDILFRAPNGQTGLLREGEDLGGVKLLKIGTNRVLIEHEGHQQELMIFSGFGSGSLMTSGKEATP